MVFFPLGGVFRGFSAEVYDEYASPQTLVRPCPAKKILISGLDTERCHLAIAGWALVASNTSDQRGNDRMPDITQPHIVVNDMTLAYGSYVVQKNVSFTVNRGDVFIIMGGSGCGKSTTMRGLTGLKPPSAGDIFYDGVNFYGSAADRERIRRGFGVMFQSGALWSSMTLAENVALPLEQYTDLSASRIRKIVSLKMALVGLGGFEDFYPSEISGGMQKRAGVARAMAMDPEVLFFDEPSAGLDPVSARRLDDLILELSDSLKTTMVVVTHELASIFAIASNSVFLDPETKTAIAHGDPKRLLAESDDPKVIDFLTRGEGKKP